MFYIFIKFDTNIVKLKCTPFGCWAHGHLYITHSFWRCIIIFLKKGIKKKPRGILTFNVEISPVPMHSSLLLN